MNSDVVSRAVRPCDICQRSFVYRSDRIYCNPQWKAHLICEPCGIANGVEPTAINGEDGGDNDGLKEASPSSAPS